MSEKTSPGQSEGLESEKVEGEVEEPTGPPDRLDKLYKLIETQTGAIMKLTGKLAEMHTKVEELESHQDKSDAAIVEVAKGVSKVGGGGGGSNLLAQILPFLQSRGPGPLEKIAMQSFLRTMAFASLTTERIAKRQYGDEYTKMVREMEADISGTFTEKPK